MKISKNQHFIPRFYLDKFIQPGWVYLRGSQQPRQVQSSKRQAVREFYYSQDTEEQNRSLDSLNTSIENETAPILQKLLTTEVSLTDADKLLFSYFIANLALRVPVAIEERGETTLQAFEQATEMAKIIVEKEGIIIEKDQPYIQDGANKYTYEEWMNLLESLRRRQNKDGKAMMETIMCLINYLAPIIANMGWVIIDASDEAFFVTSDRPVHLTDSSRRGAGWGNANAVGTLPLSPRRYLGLHYSLPPDTLGYKRISAEEVEVLNARTIASASYAIFSPKSYPPAETWLLKKKN